MIVQSERIVVALLILVTTGSTSPARSESAEPGPESKPALQAAEQKLLDEFRQTYALKDDEVVKHFAPPFHPGRIVYYRTTQPAALIRSESEEPDSYFFRWTRNELNCAGGAVWGVGGIDRLISVLLDFDRHEIEGDEKLLKIPIRGDWIVRDGAADEKLLAEIEKILREQLEIPLKISVRQLDREVLVAKGEFRFTPIGDSKRIEIYGRTLVNKGGGGGSGDLDEFLRGVSRFTGKRVVGDVAHPPEARLRWHYNVRLPHSKFAHEDRDVKGVLKHLSEQTGLTFSPRVRPVRVLTVEQAR